MIFTDISIFLIRDQEQYFYFPTHNGGNIQILQSKLRSSKSLFSKSLNACAEDLVRFKGAQGAAAEARVKRLASEALDSLTNSKSKLKAVREVGELLITEVNKAGSAIEKGDEVAMTVEADLDVYDGKLRKFMDENDVIIHEAEGEISKKDEVMLIQKVGNNSEGWQSFKPNASLKPNHLEKDSSALEVQAFM